jgi:hypothetical protein
MDARNCFSVGSRVGCETVLMLVERERACRRVRAILARRAATLFAHDFLSLRSREMGSELNQQKVKPDLGE